MWNTRLWRPNIAVIEGNCYGETLLSVPPHIILRSLTYLLHSTRLTCVLSHAINVNVSYRVIQLSVAYTYLFLDKYTTIYFFSV